MPDNQVQFELIKGNRGRLTEEGWELFRRAIAYNVTGTGEQKIVNAATLPAMPDIGDDHPFVEDAKLIDITPESIDGDTVSLILRYKGGYQGGAHISIRSSGAITQNETNFDADEVPIVVEHTFPSDYKYNASIIGQTIVQGALVPIFTPEFTMSVTQEQDDKPYALQGIYVGKINAVDWQDPGDEFLWLCTGIVGDKIGTRWNVTYSFQYNRAGWAARVVFIDPQTGKPPEDLVEGTGFKDVAIYPEVSFNDLGFVF